MKKSKVRDQIYLQQEIQQTAKINIVNCGRCGAVVLHKIEEEEITCPYCEFKSEPCDFPDYLYEGMPESD